MKNKWNNSEAKKYISQYKQKNISKELSLRIYTTHLLGREKDLVLHGGGNTSLKTSIKNVFKQIQKEIRFYFRSFILPASIF